MSEKGFDKCPVCDNKSFWYFAVSGVKLCACRKCGTVKATNKCMKETEARSANGLRFKYYEE